MHDEHPVLRWPRMLLALDCNYWSVHSLSFIYWTSTIGPWWLATGMVVRNTPCTSVALVRDLSLYWARKMLQRSCQHSFWKRRKCRIHRSIDKALYRFWYLLAWCSGVGGRHWTGKIFKLVIIEWLEGEERKVLHINYSKIRKDVWWDLKMKRAHTWW